MKAFMEAIVENTFLFTGVMLFLVTAFLFSMRSIFKSAKRKKKKISVLGEETDSELAKAKENDIIEKPKKKDKKEDKKKEKEEEKRIEEEAPKPEPVVEEPISEPEAVEPPPEKEIVPEVKEEPLFVEAESVMMEEPEPEPEIVANAETIEESKLDELERIEDKEIEDRIDKEHKEDIEEEIKNNDNEEIKEILTEMKDIQAINPEEVVKNFEQEQEAQSIISYQELVEVVKSRDNEYIDDLENKPLATVSDFIADDKNPKTSEPDLEVLELIEQLENVKYDDTVEVEELLAISDSDVEVLTASYDEGVEVLEPVREEIIQESKPEIPDEGKFKKTDVISPVYGKINVDNMEYPRVEKFNREAKEEVDQIETLDMVEETREAEFEQIPGFQGDFVFEDISDVEEIEELPTVNQVVEEQSIKEELPTMELPVEEEGQLDSEFDMPEFELPNNENNDTMEIEEAGALEALGTFNNMLENVSIELKKKDKKPEEVIDDISTDTEEIAALSSTHNFSKNEDFLKALKEFKDNL